MKRFGMVYLLESWQHLDNVFSFAEIKDEYERKMAEMMLQEIRICENKNVPFYYLLRVKKPEQFTMDENGQFRNCEYRLFDKDKKPILQINNETLLLRSWCAETQHPLNYIASIGADNAISWEDELKILDWHKYVSNSFTKRSILEITKSQLDSNLLKKFSQNRDKVFVKSRAKNFGAVTDTALSHFAVQNPLEALQDSAILIISEPLDLCFDNHRSLEYRIWIGNHTITSISRYSDDKIEYDVPLEIITFAEKFIDNYKTVFAPHYILDLGIDSSKGVAVIELNGLISSGRYYDNKFCKFLDSFVIEKL